MRSRQVGSLLLCVAGAVLWSAAPAHPSATHQPGSWPQVASSVPQDRQIVLYCKSGVRSAEALAAVKAAGFSDAVHVAGGVTAWVRQIDPSLPAY